MRLRGEMKRTSYDTIIIGSGPAGEGAAMKLAQNGQRVAIVDARSEVGGGSTHLGTIPSKALRHTVRRMMEYNTNPLFREVGEPKRLTFPQIMGWTKQVIHDQVVQRSNLYHRNDTTVIHGRARFIDTHTIEVRGRSGRARQYEAEHFILAMGSRPYRPPDVDFNHPRIFDSDTLLSLDRQPRSIIIYGAGVIGCEYASIFRGLGVRVDLVDTRERLLNFLDDEISDALGYHLRELGVLVRHQEEYERVEADEYGVTLYLKSGKRIRRDIMLWANGRTGNTQNMGLEELGIEPNGRGHVEVNNDFQTAQPHIYAVGDIIGHPNLASAALDQGRYAATHLLTGECDYRLAKDIPAGIYTIPEISSVGKTERELTAAKIPYEVGHALFKRLARAQISGQTTGMLKLLFHSETLELLGIHCFGDQAAEIVHIGQAIMAQPGSANTLMYFINTTFNYPTMAEAYRVAALNGLGRLSS